MTDLVFVGDSVSTQLCQFLICDLLRAGASFTSGSHLAVRSFEHTVAELSISAATRAIAEGKNPHNLTSQKQIIRLHNQQFNLPCVRSAPPPECASPGGGEESAYLFTSSLLRNHTVLATASPTATTYVVFNYGLHLKLKSRSGAIPGMLRALVDVARERRAEGRPVHFFFRETSSQTFTSSDGESYL